jgi:hypothetical protein
VEVSEAPVPSVTLEGIILTTKPTKISYNAGDTLVTKGLAVAASYSDGTSKTVTGFKVSPTALNTAGTITITVSYTENGVTKTVTFPVTVTVLTVIELEPEITYDGDKTTATVTNDLVDKILASIDASVNAGVTPNVSVTVPGSGPVDVVIQSSALAGIASAGANISVATETGKILLDKDTLSGLSSGGDLTISIRSVSTDELNDAQKEKVGDNPVVDITSTLGGVQVKNLGGTATITLPYELAAGRDPSNLVVWYIDEEGNVTEFPCTYDASKKTVTFETAHFSLYAVVYSEGSDDGNNILLYIAIVAIVLLVVIIAIFAYRRSNKETTS